jgi:hypothetical protein
MSRTGTAYGQYGIRRPARQPGKRDNPSAIRQPTACEILLTAAALIKMRRFSTAC